MEQNRESTFYYQHHYEMKQNRLIKLQKTHRKCEICKKPADVIHHKDGSRDNHAIENLIVLCDKCHWIIERKRRSVNNSRFIALYGMSLREMAEKYGRSFMTYKRMHEEGILKKYLENLKKD